MKAREENEHEQSRMEYVRQVGLEEKKFWISAEERQRIKADVWSIVKEEDRKRILSEERRKAAMAGPWYVKVGAQF